MRFAFIEEHRDTWPIKIPCAVLEVSRSGFYAWRGREPIATQRRQESLTETIREIHHKSDRIYGGPRVYRELLQQGHAVNQKTVEKYMREADLRSKTHRKFRVSTTDSNHSHPIAPNIVNRNFSPSGKNETWTADITYIPTDEGWLYLAVVEDLFTRKIVGWSMSGSMESRLVVDALEMAVQRELPGEDLVAHSDRGVQYASDHYQQLLNKHDITCSMSRKGNCWEATEAADRMKAEGGSPIFAPTESFFATLKKELVHHEHDRPHAEARHSLFKYIEVFYNRTRSHSALGYLSPAQFAEAL
jgi:putative transposase